jgi:acyl carrier protein
MGIDLLDIVFRLERSFGIKIPRGELFPESIFKGDPEFVQNGKVTEKGVNELRQRMPFADLSTFERNPEVSQISDLFTVGMLYVYILEKLRPGNAWPRKCLGPLVFFSLRPALADLSGTGEAAITPASRLDQIIPLQERRPKWRRLAETLDARLPALRRPAVVVQWMRLGLAALFIGSLALFVLGIPAADPFWLALSLLAGTGLKYGVAHLLTVPLAVCFPPSCATVKGLVKQLLKSNYGRLAARENACHHGEVWAVLEDILVEALGVDRERVTPDARLVEDLGAD